MDSNQDMPEERKDLGLRTSWASVLGELVEISVRDKVLGIAGSDKVFEFGAAEGRVTGVDSAGIWFEPLDFASDLVEKTITKENVYHIFIPFSNIRCVEAFPVIPGRRPGKG